MSPDEQVEIISDVMHEMLKAASGLTDRADVVVGALCCMIASQIRFEYGADIEKQEQKLEQCSAYIRKALEHNNARTTQ